MTILVIADEDDVDEGCKESRIARLWYHDKI